MKCLLILWVSRKIYLHTHTHTERERQRQRQRQRQRETKRQTDGQKETQRNRDRKRNRKKEKKGRWHVILYHYSLKNVERILFIAKRHFLEYFCLVSLPFDTHKLLSP